MATSSFIATYLDAHFLSDVRGVTIQTAPATSDPALLPARSGQAVADELAGRLLLRYLRFDQLGVYADGTTDRTYVTPTPYDAEEAVRWLNLPLPWEPRPYLLFLDASKIPLVIGPLWVSLVRGIQYVLPEGFPAEAIVVPGAPGARWETAVT